MAVIDDTLSTINTPFKQPLDVWHLFLVTGIVIVAAGLWFRVLVYLREGARELIE